jgi:hypothetical protein
MGSPNLAHRSVDDGRAIVVLRHGGGDPGAVGRLENHGDTRRPQWRGLVVLVVLAVFGRARLRVLSARRLLSHVSRNTFHIICCGADAEGANPTRASTNKPPGVHSLRTGTGAPAGP